MLQHLSIQNYALIDQLEIDFSEGLTIITGETGAGKSILLGALSLLVGQRADTQVLQDKNKKCIVEGIFKINTTSFKSFFEKHELDNELLTTIRREINPEGKSRAFINDTPVNLNQLKEFGNKLIDIHSQHETLMLNDSGFQMSVIDACIQHNGLLNEYQSEFKRYKEIENKLKKLIEEERQAKKDIDYFQFLYNEIEEADLKAEEQAELEQELEMLNNTEEITSNLSKASYILDGDEKNLLSDLNEIKILLDHLSKFNTSIHALNERVKSSYIELKDIKDELNYLQQEVIFNPQRLEDITGRLDTVYRLQQKHHVKTIHELLELKESFSDKLNAASSLETQINKLNEEIESLRKTISLSVQKISEERRKVIPEIEKNVSSMLYALSIADARFKIEHSLLETFTHDGIDKIKFLFSANKGSDFKELNKVASGGELSRLMLSIKSLVAQSNSLSTIVFDEIDTGVSGDVADKVGTIMEKMAASMQVITITHLPQIASKGGVHLFVYKENSGERTLTRIKNLKKEERIQEIAKMLSSGEPGNAAIKNAKELLRT